MSISPVMPASTSLGRAPETGVGVVTPPNMYGASGAGPAVAATVAASDARHTVSNAIAVSRSGIQDISRLLMHQPSIHPVLRSPTPTPKPKVGSQSGLLSHSSLAFDDLQDMTSNVFAAAGTAGAEHGAHVQQGALQRQRSRLKQGSLNSDIQPGNSPSPVLGNSPIPSPVPALQLFLPATTSVLSASSTTMGQPGCEAVMAAPAGVQHLQTPMSDAADLPQALTAQPEPRVNSSHHSTVGVDPVQGNASAAASDVRRKLSTSSKSIGPSVKFQPLSEPQNIMGLQQRGNSGNGNSQVDAPAIGKAQQLVRYTSTLAAAVGQTMQDRMLAGGMMQGQEFSSSAGISDRCMWVRKADPSDRCPWPKGSAVSDWGSWSTGILEKPTDEHVSRASTDFASTVSSSADQSWLEDQMGSGKSMPLKLSRHRSNLKKVSKRPDFSAAMTAVHESWIANQQKDSLLTNSQTAVSSMQTKGLPEMPNFESVWASISHASDLS